MKRKITKIGKFLLAASLMLGATSWANAEKGKAPAVGKKHYDVVQSWDFNASWAEDSVKFYAAGTAYWSRTLDSNNENMIRRFVSNMGKNVGFTNGKELTFANDEKDTISMTKGLLFTNKENGKGWVSNTLTFRTYMDPDFNCIQFGKKVTIGFSKSPEVGDVVEIVFKSANTKARGFNVDGCSNAKALFDYANSKGGIETRKWKVTGANPTFSSNDAVIVHKITVYHPTEEVDSVRVGYVGAPLSQKDDDNATNYYEPVYDALMKIANIEGNKLKVDYIEVKDDATSTFANDLSEKYDVLVVGSLAAGDIDAKKPRPFYASFDSVIGTLPVLNTKAFWHNNTRMKWAGSKGGQPSAATYQVAPLAQYRNHPLFAGLVDPEILTAQKINMFPYDEKAGMNTYLQGYPDDIVKNRPDSVPVHKTIAQGIATNDSKVNTIAESWSRANPYMLIGINNADLVKKKPTDGVYKDKYLTLELTADAQQLISNAVNYLANANEGPAEEAFIDEIKNVKISFEPVNPTGKNLADTVNHKLVITVDSVKSLADITKLAGPTIYYTLDGSEPATTMKPYNATKPDTLWEDCTVKVLVVADGCANVTASQAFKNTKRPALQAITIDLKQVGKTAADSMLYTLVIPVEKLKVDGKDTTATIHYTLDGTAVSKTSKVYDPEHPDTLWNAYAGHELTIQALAECKYFTTTATAKKEKWVNPTLPVAAAPEIKSNVPKTTASIYEYNFATVYPNAKIYYTTDGKAPTDKSSLYDGTLSLELFDTTVISAIAYVDYFAPSRVVTDTAKVDPSSVRTLAVPEVVHDGNTFSIKDQEGITPDSYSVYYTLDGSEPSDNNGLKYTGPVTYSATGSYIIRAFAKGYGYKKSAISDSVEFKPAVNEELVFGKVLYKSTFNREDPSVRYDDPASPEAQTWGWFRWALNKGGGVITGNKHDESLRYTANKYITDEEWNAGVYYDAGKNSDDGNGPRVQIYESGTPSEWRGFNDWVFWKESTSRRMLVQNYDIANVITTKDTTASDGALMIFNAGGTKAVAGPDSTFKGPFAVKVIVNNAENGTKTFNAGSLGICITDAAKASNELQIGEVKWNEGEFGSDTIYYYGDQEVYVRLTTTDADICIFDFIVYQEGAILPPLAYESTDPQGGTYAEPTEVEEPLTTIKVTFNNPLASCNADVIKWSYMGNQHACTATVEDNVLTVTLPEDGVMKAGEVWYLELGAGAVTDTNQQPSEEVENAYYTLKSSSAIDEVSAAKEVVATHIYSISGAEIPALTPGVNFVKTIYSDGSVTTEKIQVK